MANMVGGSEERYDPEDIIDVIHKVHGNISDVTRVLGCCRQTFYNYRNRYPEVQEALEEAKAIRLDRAEYWLERFIEAAEDDIQRREQLDAIKFFLSTLGKSRGYSKREELGIAALGEIKLVFDD